MDTLEIVGPYRVGKLLGRGGTAVVHEAWDGSQRRVALKRLHDGAGAFAGDKFLREVGRMRDVRHPNLVRILDGGRSADGSPYIAMELVQGEPLTRLVERGPVPVDEAVRIALAVCAALEALHAEGLIHRDIKPENVMLDPSSGHVTLLDLGLARETGAGASTTTRGGVVHGTPAYMAPERFFGARASAESDVYEIAVLLLFLLAGRIPWTSDEAHARLSPSDPRALRPDIPDHVAEAILDALSTNPATRPARAGALADRLAQSGARSPRSTSPIPMEVGTMARNGQPPSRGRAIVVLAVVATVTAAGLAARAPRGAPRVVTTVEPPPSTAASIAPVREPPPNASAPAHVARADSSDSRSSAPPPAPRPAPPRPAPFTRAAAPASSVSAPANRSTPAPPPSAEDLYEHRL